MANFKTTLDSLVHDTLKVLGVILPVAEAVEPEVAVFAPEALPFYNLAIVLIKNAEAASLTAKAAATPTIVTGNQKMALVVQDFQRIAMQYKTTAEVQAYIQGVYDSLTAQGIIVPAAIMPNTPATVHNS